MPQVYNYIAINVSVEDGEVPLEQTINHYVQEENYEFVSFTTKPAANRIYSTVSLSGIEGIEQTTLFERASHTILFRKLITIP